MQRQGRREARTWLLAAGLTAMMTVGPLFVGSGRVHAAEFVAVIANLDNVRRPHAQIDVAVDTRAAPSGATVLFQVYNSDGIWLAEFEVAVNDNGMASSSWALSPYDNLFAVSRGEPALVRVVTPTAITASANLRHRLRRSESNLGLQPLYAVSGWPPQAAGTLFSIPLGPATGVATVLVGNACGTEVAADIYIGTAGSPGAGKYTTPRIKTRAFWIVDVDPADAASHLVVRATCDVVVQLALDGVMEMTGVSVP